MRSAGCAHVSSTDQDLAYQIAVLPCAGCHKIISDKVSGTRKGGRQTPKERSDDGRDGDTLVVTRFDRPSRSLQDLHNLAHVLESQKIKLRATEQAIDTSSAAGNAFPDRLGVFADFEPRLRQARQRGGVARAKENGAYRGRKPTALAIARRVMALTLAGLVHEAVAGHLQIGKAGVYRIVKAWRLQPPDAILLAKRIKPHGRGIEPGTERATMAS